MIKTLLNKYKQFLSDIFLNTLAFGIYMIAQQIVLLPVLAKQIDESTYAVFLIYISFLNLICNSVGSQLGVTQQVESYKNINTKDYEIVLNYLSVVITIISVIFLIVLRCNVIDIIFLTLIVLLTNYRFYVRYIFRIESDYSSIIKQNLIYLTGIVVGLLSFYIKKIVWIPMLVGELLCLIFDIYKLKKIDYRKCDNSDLRGVINRFSGYCVSTILSNACNLIDKILISPLLGQLNLIIYSVGTTVSKVLALVSNPINDVILAWISKSNNNTKVIISAVLKLCLVIGFISFVLSIPIIYIATSILYKQYLDDIENLIIMFSLSGSISFVTSMMKSFVIRFSKSIKLVNVYLTHIILFTILGYFGAKYFGLFGFVLSTILSRIQLWVSFVIILYNILKKQKGVEIEKGFITNDKNL